MSRYRVSLVMPRFLTLEGCMIRPLLASLLLLPAAASAQSLAGTYVYESPAGPVTLILDEEGAALTGRMTGADGAVFRLQGTIDSGRATGSIEAGEDTGWFAAGMAEGRLLLLVGEVDPDTGGPDLDSAWSLDFARVGAEAGVIAPPAARRTDPAQRPGGVEEASLEHDPALVGLWVHSDTYVSGDFSATTRVSLSVNPDGTYLYGKGDVTLGGDYIGRGRGGDVTGGRWRTEGGVVYIMEEGSAGWVPHARYYLEGSSLLFTFADGSRQLWNRQ